MLGKITSTPIWPIIQGCNVPDKLSNNEFKEAIRIAEVKPSEGVIVFSWSHLEKEKRFGALTEAWNVSPKNMDFSVRSE